VLWLSGLLWLALGARYPLFGWAQLAAALAVGIRQLARVGGR